MVDGKDPRFRGDRLAEGLRAFARRGDRSHAEFFVGRRAEFGEIERVCADALAAVRGGGPFGAEPEDAPGVTRLFQGAPGAGKSCLLTEMAKRWTARALEAEGTGGPGSAFGTPLPVRLEWHVLLSEERTARTILKASDEEAETAARCTESGGVAAGVAAGPFRAAFRTGGSTAPLTVDLLKERMPEGGWIRPVVLLIDEIHQASADVLPVLNMLHQGNHGLPLVPVLAGLGSSRDRLREIGLSRFTAGAVRPLGALAREEALEALDRLFKRYRVDLSDADRAGWEAWLVDRSDCWPQHLYNAMSALAVGLADSADRRRLPQTCSGGPVCRLADVDFPAVDAAEARLRVEDAYRPRVSTEMKMSRFLLAAVMERLPPKGADIIDIAAAIEEEAADKPGWRIPARQKAEEFLSDLVHQGVLQAGKKDLFRCPIPSLRGWLAAGMPDPPEPPPPARQWREEEDGGGDGSGGGMSGGPG